MTFIIKQHEVLVTISMVKFTGLNEIPCVRPTKSSQLT